VRERKKEEKREERREKEGNREKERKTERQKERMDTELSHFLPSRASMSIPHQNRCVCFSTRASL
jgi:hypothetical protein